MNDVKDELKLVFFARAMQDYGTEYEQTWIENIDANIISFNEVNELISKENKYKVYGKDLYEVERKYFFPLIDKSDYVVAAPAWNHTRKGQFTKGVIIEIEYALSIGKKVFGIVNGIMKIITEEDIRKIKGDEKDDDIMFQVPGEEPVTRKELMEMHKAINEKRK